jgi:hypothetical protein
MTVRELIEKLREMPQDLPVMFDSDQGPTDVEGVFQDEYGYGAGNRQPFVCLSKVERA